MARGCRPEWFEGVPIDARSTEEEALAFRDFLVGRGVGKAALVTSNFHTRRAGKIFRETVPQVQWTIIEAPYPDFAPATWWSTREGRKTFFYEYLKTVSELVGL